MTFANILLEKAHNKNKKFHLKCVTLNQRCLLDSICSSGASFLFKSTAHNSTVTSAGTQLDSHAAPMFIFHEARKWARSNVGKRLHQTRRQRKFEMPRLISLRRAKSRRLAH
jgi:hypothetical protein